MTGFEQDPHSEGGNSCPRNRFGLTRYADLEPIEAILVAKRGGELEDFGVTGVFDVAHLRAIHRYLFQDVFPWAGEFRVVNIAKTASFAPAMHVAGALTETLEKLNREGFLRGLSVDGFAERAAFYLGEINAIHPFREGNGRTQREFIRQLALGAGHRLLWVGFTQEEMIEASVASHTRGDNAGLADMLRRALLAGHPGMGKS